MTMMNISLNIFKNVYSSTRARFTLFYLNYLLKEKKNFKISIKYLKMHIPSVFVWDILFIGVELFCFYITRMLALQSTRKRPRKTRQIR